MKTNTVIAPTTGAVAAASPIPIEKFPCTIMAPGLAGAETALLWFTVDDGASWEAYTGSEPTQITLSATRKTFVVDAPIKLGISKSSTVAAVGVYQSTFNPTDGNFDKG